MTMGNSPDNSDVVILAAARTPQGRINGQLSSLTAVDLGAHAIRAALAASGIDAADVEAVIMGQVLQAGAGQNPARQSSIGAGIGWDFSARSLDELGALVLRLTPTPDALDDPATPMVVVDHWNSSSRSSSWPRHGVATA